MRARRSSAASKRAERTGLRSRISCPGRDAVRSSCEALLRRTGTPLSSSRKQAGPQLCSAPLRKGYALRCVRGTRIPDAVRHSKAMRSIAGHATPQSRDPGLASKLGPGSAAHRFARATRCAASGARRELASHNILHKYRAGAASAWPQAPDMLIGGRRFDRQLLTARQPA
jgi:hypothetical protein